MTHMTQWFRTRAVLGLVAGSAAVTGACGVSTQQELEMGAQYAAEINQQLPILNDASVNNYINSLGRSIAQRGGRQIGYRFYVVNAPEVNAFAVPGGHVYLNRGLIERTRSMGELAGVLAHEIAHVELRHGVEQMERAQGANLAVNAAYILLGRAPSGVESAAINIGGTAWFASHSREAENESDAMGVELLVASGINPGGIPTFFQVLINEQQRTPSTVEQWFSTHPLTQDRVTATQAMVNRYNAAQLRGLRTDDNEYASMKSRLRQLPAAPRR
jgi:predicted Zn-dependent protease